MATWGRSATYRLGMLVAIAPQLCLAFLPAPSRQCCVSTAPLSLRSGIASVRVHGAGQNRRATANARQIPAPDSGPVRLCAQASEEESMLSTRGYKIWYSVASPDTPTPRRLLKHGGSCTPLPIVVLHGGPGVPSDYLQPLKVLAVREQRKMFFYDQLGCGRSEGPADESFYSVPQAAEDAVTMLQHFADFHGLLDLGGFHLYGHSWGGCLAVEVLLRQLPKHPRLAQGVASVVLSNAPDSPKDSMQAARKLIDGYKDEMWGLKPDEIGMPADWPREDDFIQQWKLQQANAKFERTNNLRLDYMPQALQRAYSRMGVHFYGEKVVRSWRVEEAELRQEWPAHVPALVMRGEHDFVSTEAVACYVEGIPLAQYAQLSGLSHMAHLEDPERYKGVLDGWLLSVESGRVARE